MQENEVGPLPHILEKVNPEWINDLNIRAKTILEENAGGKLHDFRFLEMAAKVGTAKEKVGLHQK